MVSVDEFFNAARRGDLNTLQQFIDEHGDVNCIDNRFKENALTIAILSRNFTCIELFIKAGVDVNYVNGYGNTALNLLVHRTDETKYVKMLLDAGANVNCICELKTTSLITATQANHYHCVEMLLDAGADVNYEYNNGKTAASYANPNILELFT